MDSRSSAGKVATIAAVLRDAAETHHIVFKIVDGADADWASWYADWLLRLSPLPALLGGTPVRSELVYCLVQCDKEFTAAAGGGQWEDYYAERLLSRLGAG